MVKKSSANPVNVLAMTNYQMASVTFCMQERDLWGNEFSKKKTHKRLMQRRRISRQPERLSASQRGHCFLASQLGDQFCYLKVGSQYGTVGFHVVFSFSGSYRSVSKKRNCLTETSIANCLLTVHDVCISFNSLIYIHDEVCRSSTRLVQSDNEAHFTLDYGISLIGLCRLRVDSLETIMTIAGPIQRVQKIFYLLLIDIYTSVTISPFKCLHFNVCFIHL